MGKFITADNDYFYPAAAPIIYATFLIAVLVWLNVRRRHEPDPRGLLLTALQLLEESVDGGRQRDERDALRARLATAARAPESEQRRLAEDLLAFVEAEELKAAPDPVDPLALLGARLRARSDRWLGGHGLRVLVVAMLLITGVGQLLALLGVGADVAFDLGQPMTPFLRFQLLHLAVEAVAGGLLAGGAVLVGLAGRHRLGWTLSYFGLLVALTLADLISFYVRQFDSFEVALGHLVLLAGVIFYRRELSTERRSP